MIRIFAQAFVYGNIFSKSKTNMDDDKNENFRIEIVKKRLDFRSETICFVEIYLATINVSHMRSWNWEIVCF